MRAPRWIRPLARRARARGRKSRDGEALLEPGAADAVEDGVAGAMEAGLAEADAVEAGVAGVVEAGVAGVAEAGLAKADAAEADVADTGATGVVGAGQARERDQREQRRRLSPLRRNGGPGARRWAQVTRRKARVRGRRLGARHRTLVAVVVGVLAVGPAAVGVGAVAAWVGRMPTVHTQDAALTEGYDPQNPRIEQVAVDGSLPDSPVPLPLPAYDLPNGPLGIPVTALAAYKHAAGVLGKEQPGCHIDWALIASIGRIESHHARGGYVDAAGTTLEPILGPELNGTGPYAAIPDTDHGLLDHDTVWDRAVGPAQFIPATWRAYASDGDGDGIADPNNLFDSSLATGRYLCSGGLDLANPDQLRTAIYRYNNSDAYVNTVILWAEAYRNGVASIPDSQIPIGAPNAAAVPAPPAVPPPPVPPSGPGTPPSTSLPPSGNPGNSSSPTTPGTSSSTPTCVSTTPTTTTPTTTTPTTPSLPPCGQPSSAPPSDSGPSSGPTGNASGS